MTHPDINIISLQPVSIKQRAQTCVTQSALFRIVTSKHLRDIQFIILVVVCCLVFAYNITKSGIYYNADGILELFREKPSPQAAFLLASVAAAAAILHWSYQTASRRLGLIDIFACEISVITRTCLVVDFARISLKLAESFDGPLPQKISSEEQYTPVYDGNISELSFLDAHTLKHVASFYTYRKVMMDYLRASIEAANTKNEAMYENNMSHMIYMQFLMYESARYATDKLIEYEPDHAENTVNILCSEIVLYAYLYNKYEGEFRGDRLELRKTIYEGVVQSLINKIERNSNATSGDSDWKFAKTTSVELIHRYKVMCSDVDRGQNSDKTPSYCGA